MPEERMPEFTGERVIPGQVDADLFNEHFSRYAFARRFAEHRRVLDLGCGTGYGAAALAEVADSVLGVDFSADAIRHAREHYARANLTFEQADVIEPVDGRFDLITAFEVIEHLENWRGLLRSAREQLADGGLLIVSTPNKPVYAETRGPSGVNEFHVHEFEYREFQEALSEIFPHVEMLVQNHSAGLVFAPVRGKAAYDVPPPEGDVQVETAQFFVALCSMTPFGHVDAFFWIPSSANLLHDRDKHIALLRGEVDLKTAWMDASRAELKERNREYEELLRLQDELKQQVEERNNWALQQVQLVQTRGERIEQLQQEAKADHAEWAIAAEAYEGQLRELEAANLSTTEWATEMERRLTADLNQRGSDLARAVELLIAAETTIEERTLWAQGLERELIDWQGRWSALNDSTWVHAGRRFRLLTERT